MQSFSNFEMPQKLLYGRDSLSQLGELAASLGQKALIVSDRIMEKVGYVEKCTVLLNAKGISCAYYLDANSEPSDAFVQDALRICEAESCDIIVAIGGGSCIDTAKAVSVVATNKGYIGEFMGGKRIAETVPLPVIAIPTTAGTGSEVTNVAVITNLEKDVKMMIKQSAFLPRMSIVDPFLTLTTPKNVTSATGLDALCHAIEAYFSKSAHPMTDSFALSAIELITKNIKRVYEHGDDVDAREKMSLAAMQAGVAFSNASVTLIHGMSRPIGALFHVPHGISNAMLLPACLSFSKEAATPQLAVIGRLIDPDAACNSDSDWADHAIAVIKGLCHDLNIPNLKGWGIDEAKFNEVLDKMATDALASGSPNYNPVVPTHAEIIELYRTCYHYDYAAK
ncbi:iron-containing alcohol dehydrogenase [Fusibacter paucivorans]|uniref:Iron-containing alcohol dehydrogenase n=1 Tax=Fusibacter paucivorans TaxID=76009 RepID=A0ABS5PQD3_9FIRM|nr:iron-containing alcohol dehydrogenase [Fusibacter paucivorans]MBS7526247.1 iron-containing alcohol dehydrogenase [Fusibacter paucivorans]